MSRNLKPSLSQLEQILKSSPKLNSGYWPVNLHHPHCQYWRLATCLVYWTVGFTETLLIVPWNTAEFKSKHVIPCKQVQRGSLTCLNSQCWSVVDPHWPQAFSLVLCSIIFQLVFCHGFDFSCLNMLIFPICVHAQSLSRVWLLCDSVDYRSTRLLCPWDYPSKNTAVGCHFLLQGIFPSQGLKIEPRSTVSHTGRRILHFHQTWEFHLSSC